MKRLFSILISSLILTTSAWAVSTSHINSYATRTSVLNGGVVADDRTVDVEFYVMAPTNGVWVYLDMNENGKIDNSDVNIYANETLDATAGSGNRYDYETVTCTIPNEVPLGEYKWLVKVRGKQDHSTWTVPQVVRDYENTDYRYSFSRAMGVAVDCSYESDFLGHSYVAETHYQRNAWGNANSTKTDGVYMFGPAMGKVFNSASGSYGAYNNTGSTIKCNVLNSSSYAFGRDDESSSKYWLEYSPARLCTDGNGYVYICENVPAADRTAKVFRMDPANPTKQFEVVLTTSHIEAAAKEIKGDVNGLPKRVQSTTVVTDEQGNKFLYAILGTEESQLLYQSVCLCVFNINDLKSVTYAGKYKSLYQFDCTISTKKQTINNLYNQIVPGKNGDVWIFQSRGSGGTDGTLSGTIHLDKNLNCDFIIPTTATGLKSGYSITAGNHRGSGAVSMDGSMLVIPSSSTSITCYNVTYDSNDKSRVTSLSTRWTWNARPETLTSGEAHNVDAMAFDVADNLYFTVNVGTYPSTTTASDKPKGRLYVYALPKADNSHVTPARSSQTIKVSDNICWHPYPDSYSMTNEDLFEMFKRDYKAKYGRDCDFSSDTYSSEFMDMLTNANSQWKWLGDFFNSVGAQRRNIPTNEELWGTDNTSSYPTNGIKKEFNTWCESNNIAKRSNQKITDAAVFFAVSGAASKSTYNFLTNNAKYKWLGDYIKEVAKAQGTTLTSSYAYWHWLAHAFFNKDNKKSDAVNGGDYTHNFDFSSAGEPSHWRAAYLAGMKAQGVEVTINNDPINQASEWRVCAGTFFGQLPTETSQGFVTTNIYNKREHEHWYALWLASLPATPEAVKANGFPVPVRKDHILAGWYYGTKCETGTKAYNINSPANTTNIAYACVYARWIETCLHEGEVIDPQMLKEQQATYRNFNIDLINLLAGQEVAIKIDRKLVGGMYNTMCLPFDIAGKEAFSQIVYADGSGSPFAKVGEEYPFSLVKYVGTQAGENELILDFDELGAAVTLPANTPFLLKPNADITKPLKYNAARISGGGAQPASDEDDNEELNNTLGQNYGITVGDRDEYFTYTGVLAPTTIPDGSVLLVADNRLAQSTSGEMKGMRGFFTAKIQPLEMPAVVRINSRDGVTTYLDAINMTTESKTATKVLHNGNIYILRGDEIYTLTGARVK